MIRMIFILIGCIINVSTIAQKPSIDSSVYNSWPSLGLTAITNDGKYVQYEIAFGPSYSRTGKMLVLQSTKDNWKFEVHDINYLAEFTADSRMAIFKTETDSLCIVMLGKDAYCIPQVRKFTYAGNGTDEWLAFQLKNGDKKLIIRNLKTGKETIYPSVENYLFSSNGKLLVLKETVDDKNMEWQKLILLDLNNGSSTTFWEGTGAGKIMFDKNDQQLAFTTEEKNNQQTQASIWYYKIGTSKAIMLTNDHIAGTSTKLKLGDISHFNEDGTRLFFDLKKEEQLPKTEPSAVNVNVWSYTDEKLQSQQSKEINPGENIIYSSYAAVIDIENRNIICLEQENESCIKVTNDVAFILQRKGNGGLGEYHWNTAFNTRIYAISLKDGKRTELSEFRNRAIDARQISPQGNYIVFYNEDLKNFFSYELATGITRNLTGNLTITWADYYKDDRPDATERGIAAWVKDDKAVLIYDRFDIWQVDPSGRKPPINLTNGYGQKQQTIFYFTESLHFKNLPVAENEKCLLTAFNINNKDNGFFIIAINGKGDPVQLTMGHYLYEISHNPYLPGSGLNFPPLKAAKAEAYIVRRCSAGEAPNYFFTSDFKHFSQLSDLRPHKKYNWYTTELHTWKSLDGRKLQGILYKPENFDANRKYPLIFYYYERMSDALNAYLVPESLDGNCAINVPSYVSNGYLVFSPDIHYTIGNPMQGTYDAVVSAAHYVSTLNFVDTKKMGLQGCSFGGMQTNYLVTHTNLFAAAVSSASVSNFISNYGGLHEVNGSVFHGFFERGQSRMGGSLWDIPDAYIKNSPIFNAHKVSTPLLLEHGTMDATCAFTDAVQFFTALRRLGKKVWMLEYTNSGHGLLGNSINDFSVRMNQFFDHYLKDKPAPKWMTHGIPAKYKGKETGLELDHEIKTPGPGILIEETKRISER